MDQKARLASRVAAASLSVGLIVTSCGSSSSSSVNKATTTLASAGPTTTPATVGATTTAAPASSAAPTTSSNTPTGDPVDVWVIEDSSAAAGVTFPTIRAGIKARVDRINSEGGLGGTGHPVALKYCTTDFDPNKAAQCARDAVADAKAIAVAGSVSANGDAVLPVLEQGGLANVGSTAFGKSDGSSKVSFPVMGGLVAATGCEATVLRDVAGSKKIGVARGDTPGADQVSGLLTGLGVPPVGEVVTPVANPDYSAEMSAIASKSDGIVLAEDGATALKAVTALRQGGSTVALAGSGGQSWTPAKLKQAGSAADGLYLALWFATDDTAGAGKYDADMQAAGATAQSDDLSKLGWVAYELLDQVAKKAGASLNRKAILDGLNATTAFDGGGLTPPLDLTKPGKLLGGALPRFVNTSCVYAKVTGGAVKAIDGKFVTPFG